MAPSLGMFDVAPGVGAWIEILKLVLSRKGFDSGYGGVPSPVFADDSMTSLPIPGGRLPRTYADMRHPGGSVGELVAELTKNRIRPFFPAHLDPDLWEGSLPRLPGWKPAFGQERAAQSHLANNGVGPGDLFLFFGWFRRLPPASGPSVRGRTAEEDMHVMFGWLQVGEVLDVGPDLAGHARARPWLADHPHLNWHAAPGNTIYVASDRLVVGGSDLGPGGGVFGRYRDSLRLTAPGARSRMDWTLPGWFLPADGPTLTYHGDPGRWIRRDDDTCSLRSVSRGQEFVFDCDCADAEGCLDWLRDLFSVRPAPRSLDDGRVLGHVRRRTQRGCVD